MQDIEWNILFRPLALLLSIILLGSGAIYWSQNYLAGAIETHKKLKKQKSIASDKWDKTRQTLDILEVYQPEFERLRERGFIGDEQRFIWANQLQELAGSIDLPSLKYDIDSKSIPYLGAEDLELDEDFQLYQSELKLDMGLLHEEDLFKALAVLHGETQQILPPVFLRPKRCQLNRIGTGISRNPKQANLHATCTVYWYAAQIKSSLSAQSYQGQ